jgi:hypothetical protein
MDSTVAEIFQGCGGKVCSETFSIGNSMVVLPLGFNAERGGRVCLDNLKQVLSDKLLRFMPLPLSAVV